jgi:hypothetical protein
MAKENAKENMPSMRIELISEDIYSFAEVISEYETSVLTVKLRGRIQAVSSLIRRVRNAHDLHVRCVEIHLHAQVKGQHITSRPIPYYNYL